MTIILEKIIFFNFRITKLIYRLIFLLDKLIYKL
nr:MAG TPA: hypothetical protein [Caudoviricetes sp.]